MNKTQQFSDLIELVYDAALDSALWPSVLEQTCAYLHGCTANIFCQNASDSVTLFYSWGDDPTYRQSYMESYAAMNPLFPASTYFEPGVVHALDEIMPIREFKETRLYREWVEPQGILDVMHCNLERTGNGSAAIAIRRREVDGLFDEDAKSRFRLIVPHMRRALAIGHVIDFHRNETADLETTLDGLNTAVFLVAGDGQIIFANEPATETVANAQILHVSGGKLTASNRMASRELNDALLAADRGDAIAGDKGIAISLSEIAGVTHVAHVLSLKSGKRRRLNGGSASAAIFIRPVTSTVRSSLELMTRHYKLTPCEVKVAEASIAAGSTLDIAERLGVSVATVKTHLNRLYSKTETSRRSELNRLTSNFASPFSRQESVSSL